VRETRDVRWNAGRARPASVRAGNLGASGARQGRALGRSPHRAFRGDPSAHPPWQPWTLLELEARPRTAFLPPPPSLILVLPALPAPHRPPRRPARTPPRQTGAAVGTCGRHLRPPALRPPCYTPPPPPVPAIPFPAPDMGDGDDVKGGGGPQREGSSTPVRERGSGGVLSPLGGALQTGFLRASSPDSSWASLAETQ